jgi:hypothetical protein
LAGNYLCRIGVQFPRVKTQKMLQPKEILVGAIFLFYINQKIIDITCKSNLESNRSVWEVNTYNIAPSHANISVDLNVFFAVSRSAQYSSRNPCNICSIKPKNSRVNLSWGKEIPKW